MSLKIGIDIRCLVDEKKSGVAEYTENLVEHILMTDKENQYFLFYNSWKDVSLPKWNFPNTKFCGLKIPNKILNFGLKFFNFPKIDWLIKEKLDIFIMPNLNFISLSENCKKIIIVHDLSFEIYPEFFSLKSRLWHKLANLKKICNDADQIIAVSKNTATDLEIIYKIPKEKIKTIYSGIKKISANNDDLKRVKEKYNLSDNFILYLGNIEPRKNLETTIKALMARVMARVTLDTSYDIVKGHPCHNPCHNNLHLVIAGAAGYKSRHFYNDRYKSVRFIGYIPAGDKPALYKLAKIFVFPSFYEGFCFPPLEAMAQGTSVISSISSSLPEIIGNAGILINPYDAQELACAINVLTENNAIRNEMISRGFEQIKKFDWQKTAEKTINILKNI